MWTPNSSKKFSSTLKLTLLHSARIYGWVKTAIAPGTVEMDVARIFAASSLIAAFYLFLGNINVLHGANDYTAWADSLVHGTDATGANLYTRDIGMAIIHLLGGYPFTGSIIGTVIIQTAMGIAAPLLVYFTLRDWFPRAAYWAAIASVFSLSHILLSKVIHHDQPYYFFMILVAFFSARFLYSKHPGYIYATTFSLFALSLLRLLGKGMFPIFLLLFLIATIRNPRNYAHIALNAVLFIALTIGYGNWRSAQLDSPQQYAGDQVFLNLYLHSAEFQTRVLDPAFGPNSARVLERVRAGMAPTPAKAEIFKTWPGPPSFRNDHFLAFSEEELIEKMITKPNREYYYYIIEAVDDDRLLLQASIEIARAKPGFIAQYVIQNSWRALANPGWMFGRFTNSGAFQGGRHFPLGGITTAGLSSPVFYLSDQGNKETNFIPLAGQPESVKSVYFFIETLWYQWYHPLTLVLVFLIGISWISSILGLLQFVSSKFKRASDLFLGEKVLVASIGLNLLLLANICLTATLVFSLYRYDFALITIKIMLAAIGAAVLLNILSTGARRLTKLLGLPEMSSNIGAAQTLQIGNIQGARRRAYIFGGLSAANIAVFAIWAGFLTSALKQIDTSNIEVVTATFGGNCGATTNNAHSYVNSTCSAKTSCAYSVDYRMVGNPAPSCSKTFEIQWRCNGKEPLMSKTIGPGVNQADEILLSC